MGLIVQNPDPDERRMTTLRSFFELDKKSESEEDTPRFEQLDFICFRDFVFVSLKQFEE